MEDESLEALAAEDDDASMVLQFENALMHGHRARRPGTRHFLCELPRCPSALVGEVSLTWVLAGQNLQRKWKERESRQRWARKIKRTCPSNRELIVSFVRPDWPLESRVPFSKAVKCIGGEPGAHVVRDRHRIVPPRYSRSSSRSFKRFRNILPCLGRGDNCSFSREAPDQVSQPEHTKEQSASSDL